jgi:hypothetical protein
MPQALPFGYSPPALDDRQLRQPTDAPRACRSARRRRSMTLASFAKA